MNILILFFQGGGSIFSSLLIPLLIMGGIFYFLVIMPQKRQQKELKELIETLKIGEEVVTNGGVIGKIIEVRDTSFIIRSGDKSNIEIARTSVIGKRAEGEAGK